ncbi:MAG TPA: MFS transporter [Methylomirabilota bacterium]|nr:MFS transporter [Methylomirabilota bacterium]
MGPPCWPVFYLNPAGVSGMIDLVISRARAVLASACGLHLLHDGFSDVVYVFLPLWAAEFGLSFAQVGIIRTCYTGGMALFQIPAGVLAERWGERGLLFAGTALTALGFVAAGWAGGFVALLLILSVAGIGSSVQHPLSSSLISKVYEVGGRRAALGTYNFSGDVGKAGAAALIALAAGIVGWRAAGAAYGLLGLVAAGALLIVLHRLGAGGASPATDDAGMPVRGWGIRDPRGFSALAAIGMIDNATRTGFITFLPFALITKGSTVAGVGTALALLFVGGAAGKFICGLVAERVGVIRTVILTETATAAGIAAIIVAPLPMALAILVPLGVALNGTSSVLYGTVADLVMAERRSRAYGLYYTLSVGCSALAPTLYGIVGDAVGVAATLGIVATVVLVTLPLCLVLRPAVAAPVSA